MPVAVPDEDPNVTNVVTPAVEPNRIYTEQTYESQVVDTRRENYDGLATFIGGQRMAVDYYSQVLGKDDAASSFAPDLLSSYGQLEVIRGYELMVQTPFSQNQERGPGAPVFDISGSANVYGFVPPNLGDTIVAGVGDGKNVLFQITACKQITIWTESAYEIEYKSYAWGDAETMHRLNAKVVETYYFDRELMRNGQYPLLRTEQVHQSLSVREHYDRLFGLYMRDFYSTKFKTFILPGQEQPTYDPNMVRFIKATVSSQAHPRMYDVIEYSLGDDIYGQQPTLLDAILTRDYSLLYSCLQQFGQSYVENYPALAGMFTIYYSGIRKVVSPVTYIRTVNNEGCRPPTNTDTVKAGVRNGEIDMIFTTLDLRSDYAADAPEFGRYIRRVSDDNYYIFSKNFYKEEGELTSLEFLVKEYLQGKPFDVSTLIKLCEYAPKFDNLERFYYVPIILTMIQMTPGVY